jgi:hypothetical protein
MYEISPVFSFAIGNDDSGQVHYSVLVNGTPVFDDSIPWAKITVCANYPVCGQTCQAYFHGIVPGTCRVNPKFPNDHYCYCFRDYWPDDSSSCQLTLDPTDTVQIVLEGPDDDLANNAFQKTIGECSSGIPTLSEWGLIIFGLLLIGTIVWYLRRRKLVPASISIFLLVFTVSFYFSSTL